MKTAFILNFQLQVEICMAVTSSVNTPSYTATNWLHLTHIDKDLQGLVILITSCNQYHYHHYYYHHYH